MFPSRTRRGRVGCLALLAALVVLPAGSALADGGSSTHPNMTLTFKAKHGWHMSISAIGCGAKGSFVDLTAVKTGSHFTFSHYYNGPARKAGCSGSKTLRSGKVHAYWGSLFRLKMTVAGAGAKTTIPLPKGEGCTGVWGHQRAVKAHGMLNMRIHKGVLGHIQLTHVKGIMQIYDSSKNFKCTGGGTGSGGGAKSTFADGSFGGNRYLSAIKNDHTGSTSVTASGSHKLGSKVFESISDTFTGAPFTFSKDLTSAKIGSATRFMSGSVSFTGASCSPGWANGTWNSGTLKVHDGLSKVSFVGGAAMSGSVYKSTANPC